MSSVHPKRAPRGQARLELSSKKAIIAEVAEQCPNLKEVWKTLKKQGVISIAYATFCNAYREMFSEDEPSSDGKRASVMPSRKCKSGKKTDADPKPPVETRPSEAAGIGSFNHNPRNEEVRSRW